MYIQIYMKITFIGKIIYNIWERVLLYIFFPYISYDMCVCMCVLYGNLCRTLSTLKNETVVTWKRAVVAWLKEGDVYACVLWW